MKVWAYEPRGGPMEVHLRKETVLKDMEDDLYWAQQPDGGEWLISDDVIYVDDGGHAELVSIIGYEPQCPWDCEQCNG